MVKRRLAGPWAMRCGRFMTLSRVLKAVNLNNDADTTSANRGQLAGAYWGESRIPPALQSGLARRDLLESALKGLLGDTTGPAPR